MEQRAAAGHAANAAAADTPFIVLEDSQQDDDELPSTGLVVISSSSSSSSNSNSNSSSEKASRSMSMNTGTTAANGDQETPGVPASKKRGTTPTQRALAYSQDRVLASPSAANAATAPTPACDAGMPPNKKCSKHEAGHAPQPSPDDVIIILDDDSEDNSNNTSTTTDGSAGGAGVASSNAAAATSSNTHNQADLTKVKIEPGQAPAKETATVKVEEMKREEPTMASLAPKPAAVVPVAFRGLVQTWALPRTKTFGTAALRLDVQHLQDLYQGVGASVTNPTLPGAFLSKMSPLVSFKDTPKFLQALMTSLEEPSEQEVTTLTVARYLDAYAALQAGLYWPKRRSFGRELRTPLWRALRPLPSWRQQHHATDVDKHDTSAVEQDDEEEEEEEEEDAGPASRVRRRARRGQRRGQPHAQRTKRSSKRGKRNSTSTTRSKRAKVDRRKSGTRGAVSYKEDSESDSASDDNDDDEYTPGAEVGSVVPTWTQSRPRRRRRQRQSAGTARRGTRRRARERARASGKCSSDSDNSDDDEEEENDDDDDGDGDGAEGTAASSETKHGGSPRKRGVNASATPVGQQATKTAKTEQVGEEHVDAATAHSLSILYRRHALGQLLMHMCRTDTCQHATPSAGAPQGQGASTTTPSAAVTTPSSVAPQALPCSTMLLSICNRTDHFDKLLEACMATAQDPHALALQAALWAGMSRIKDPELIVRRLKAHVLAVEEEHGVRASRQVLEAIEDTRLRQAVISALLIELFNAPDKRPPLLPFESGRRGRRVRRGPAAAGGDCAGDGGGEWPLLAQDALEGFYFKLTPPKPKAAEIERLLYLLSGLVIAEKQHQPSLTFSVAPLRETLSALRPRPRGQVKAQIDMRLSLLSSLAEATPCN